ncbi:cell division protein ZapE [Rubellimicrobium aerolatum]|uniref:Cell division protein ZapE n=1 Tax=Rubellimicrobium aerolatum TaxID=490979 RepID=A0ABW0S9K7_9RHOB|nr:cell division protein ZapE [Rubellimicrobium aerolatum]MBP1804988.1 cell division protein ZapE [Rubellimicrobium aerolatum]
MTVAALYDARAREGRLAPDPGQRATLPALDRLRTDLLQPPRRSLFRKPRPVRGLYLWGDVGRGKSMLMDLALQSMGEAVPTRRQHFHAFMQWVQAALARARQTGTDDAILPVADEIAATARLLALDEMQVTDIADAMILGRLFQRLWSQGVTLLTTSNRPPFDLYKDGLNRALFLPFIAMIEAECDVVELASPTDHRQGRLQGAPRYFCPVDAASRAAMAAIWADLTGGQAQPTTLRVYGRDVEIPAFHDGCARATFYDLCGRPLGPADYLALAAAARVLLIDEIPRLGSENFNQARRFVTLIDALYEARVTLIAAAAAPPDRLYVEGEGSFEFARTASRLMEMQAADWGRLADAPDAQ